MSRLRWYDDCMRVAELSERVSGCSAHVATLPGFPPLALADGLESFACGRAPAFALPGGTVTFDLGAHGSPC